MGRPVVAGLGILEGVPEEAGPARWRYLYEALFGHCTRLVEASVAVYGRCREAEAGIGGLSEEHAAAFVEYVLEQIDKDPPPAATSAAWKISVYQQKDPLLPGRTRVALRVDRKDAPPCTTA